MASSIRRGGAYRFVYWWARRYQTDLSTARGRDRTRPDGHVRPLRPADDAESVATIQAALDAGVTLLDTGDFYGMGHNEMLLRDAIRGRRREDAQISVKFGVLLDARGGWNGVDTRPAAVKNFLAYSLRRLGTDYIDIYRPARLDPAVPVEETIGALAWLVKQGLSIVSGHWPAQGRA